MTQPDKKVISARLQALWWLTSVISDGRSVNDLLSQPSKTKLSDIPFAKQLLFGSLRYFHQIKAILDQLIEKPLKQKDNDLLALLILGIYQLRYLSVPDHAALSESVELTRRIKKKWASGLVNAVLRNYQRKISQIEDKLTKAKTFQFSHPNWIINQLEKDWPEHAAKILNENNQRAPMAIRVNQSKISINDYQTQLEASEIISHRHSVACDALILESPCDVNKLPGFEQGLVSVQDPAAQLVVELLDLKHNQTVLDGCAAPGGKTAHILQRQADLKLTSVEMSAKRIQKIKQNLARLQVTTNLKCADLSRIDDWWDGEMFDRILIDVPCSASGVIRRNPDIKIHRKKTDLANIVSIQAHILNTAWKLLKPTGRLVYATCSIFKDENENQINHFLSNSPAKIVRLRESIDEKLVNHTSIGHQIFPGEHQMDGFYLCGLEKPK